MGLNSVVVVARNHISSWHRCSFGVFLSIPVLAISICLVSNKAATGNVATEDVLYMLDGMQIETGVDMGKLLEAGSYISDFLGREPASKTALALQNRQ